MACDYWAVKIANLGSYKPKSSAGIPVNRQRRSTIALVSRSLSRMGGNSTSLSETPAPRRR
jgi:hypothetical protein